MSWIFTLLIGLIVGILAGSLVRNWRNMGPASNITTGILGAIAGYWVFIEVLGLGPQTTAPGFFSLSGLLWTALGSIGALALMNGFRASESKYQEEEERREESRKQERMRPAYGPEYYRGKDQDTEKRADRGEMMVGRDREEGESEKYERIERREKQ
jgi:uncharacterized membrane protein YeaQ/YmgE (transglycosylase-associated protein family)